MKHYILKISQTFDDKNLILRREKVWLKEEVADSTLHLAVIFHCNHILTFSEWIYVEKPLFTRLLASILRNYCKETINVERRAF